MKLSRSKSRNIDIILISAATVTCFLGVLLIFSATRGWELWQKYIITQSFGIVIGIVGIFLISKIDIEEFGNNWKYLYGINVAILLLVLFVGTGGNETGTVGWIKLGPVYVQPSEISKVLLILTLSKQLAVVDNEIDKIKSLFKLFIHCSVPILLVLLQPDTGTAVVLMFIFVVLLFVAGINKWYLLGACGVCSIVAPLMYMFMLKPYQKNRILTFLNPELSPTGSGYQVIQSKIAIGSGQIFGRGLFLGPQTQSGYVPAKHTDFIFSVIGEELGFIGCVIIISLIFFIIMRCMYIAINISDSDSDKFSRYTCVGISAMLFFHAFENIGMTIGIIPVTGIPLPFLSYGGTSIMTYMIALGIVSNISVKRRRFMSKLRIDLLRNSGEGYL